MYFLFSGEGPTDFGTCAGNAGTCDGANYNHGPMALFVDQIVESRHAYSLLANGHYGFISKQTLVQRATELKTNKKAVRLPGKKQTIETRYFYNNARVFARIALEREVQLNDEVVGILFRDSDGTAAADRGLWEDKRRSMLHGFEEEGFRRGVPMIPKPKSEAWLICAFKANPYDDCDPLEERSGNDNSPNSLKSELEGLLGATASRTTLNSLVVNRRIDVLRIEMLSLRAFRQRLEEVI